jgi:hypothetical protein
MNLSELREKVYRSWERDLFPNDVKERLKKEREEELLESGELISSKLMESLEKRLAVIGEQKWRAEHRGRMNALNDVLLTNS